MQTNAITGASTSVAGTNAAPTKELGKNEFLKLLMAQLANQDPTKPVDNQAFIAQLAQFSSVEQLQGIGAKLDTLAIAQASTTQLQTASLVGKEVLFRTDQVHLDGKPVSAEARLSVDADSVVASITDASGNVVRRLALGARKAGAQPILWDGRDEKGGTLPPGDYHVSLDASRKDGAKVQADLRGRGTVDAVTFEEDAPVLIVGTLHVKLSDVAQILRPASTT
jgi:flagellar basal-body rod modification protein FlgD